jgi:Tol biopolymer transport system component
VIFPASTRSGQADIYRATPRRSAALERLVDDPGDTTGKSACLPDGRHAGFVSSRSGQADTSGSWSCAVETAKVRNLTHNPGGRFPSGLVARRKVGGRFVRLDRDFEGSPRHLESEFVARFISH